MTEYVVRVYERDDGYRATVRTVCGVTDFAVKPGTFQTVGIASTGLAAMLSAMAQQLVGEVEQERAA
jgi:hypothetical protein